MTPIRGHREERLRDPSETRALEIARKAGQQPLGIFGRELSKASDDVRLKLRIGRVDVAL